MIHRIIVSHNNGATPGSSLTCHLQFRNFKEVGKKKTLDNFDNADEKKIKMSWKFSRKLTSKISLMIEKIGEHSD